MIPDFVERASVFQSPGDLGRLLEEHRASISNHEVFNGPQKNVLIETWTAAVLGLGLQAASGELVTVRLCGTETFPDFLVRYADCELPFEATTATPEGPAGKPGVGHRSDTSVGPVSDGPRIESPFDLGPLKDAVRRKAAKNYASPIHLCVYVMYGGRSMVFDDVVQAVDGAGGAKFESVWIITHTHMACARVWKPIGGPDGWVPIPLRPIENGA